MIPVAQGVLQTLEDDHADAFSQDKPIRLLVERPANVVP
jgi:hypothetical protein